MIVEGIEAYEVDFEYCGGKISRLTCSCFCSCNCKHEVAVALNLNMLAHQKDMDIDHDFVALDRDLFWKLASRNDFITV